ncbi:hypothetical protein ACFRIC_41110 [Streptomyces sp. NPDC056738]|uniref:hypothetical protein n=1 Tax=Streptomyces sp. NPDC056738 TaxID=3345933 RepID=UPI0036BA7574
MMPTQTPRAHLRFRSELDWRPRIRQRLRTSFSQLVKVISKPPTRWLNGWVYLATDPDPAHLDYWAAPSKTKVGGNPQAVVYTWLQRDTQAEFIAADPEICVPWLEDVTSTLDQLSADDRHRLAQIIREVAGRESDAQRQAALLETPDHLGLEGSDDE